MKSIFPLLLSTLLLSCFQSFSQETCIDLGPYDVNYLNNVTNDHVSYPVGSTFIQTGNIELIKPDQTSFYQGIQGDSLFYIGNIDIDVSSDTCTNKLLTFSTAYLEGLIVDGDTVYYMNGTPNTYVGQNFEMEFTGSGLGFGDFELYGDFDYIQLLSSTNFLFDVCLSCELPSSTECWDLSGIAPGYLDDVSMDHVTYPVGSSFITQGDIQIIKPDTWSYYQGVQGDSLFYQGNIIIDVSTASCDEKILRFNSMYVEGLVVDGDTIYSSGTTPSYYAGQGWEMEFYGTGIGNGDFEIYGDFDQVQLLTQTNFLSGVCLECVGSASISENDVLSNVRAYPNPSGDVVNIAGTQIERVSLYDIQGKLLLNKKVQHENAQVNLSQFNNGVYVLRIKQSNGSTKQIRIQVMH